MRLHYTVLLLCLGTTAWAQEIPSPLTAADFPPALASKDLPRAEPLRVARHDPAPAKADPGIPAPAKFAAAVVLPGWTDSDSRSAAAALGKECRAGAWVARFGKERGSAPRVKVLPIRNRSTAFVKTALLAHELGSALGGLAAKAGPANVLLLGVLLEQNDASDVRELQSYLLALSAVDLESGEKLWTGLHRVRQLVERSSAGKLKVTRLKPAQAVDLSGSFNDTDAAELASELLRDLTASAWLKGTRERVVRILPPRNKTAERVSTGYLSALLEHGLMTSGKVRALCSVEEQADLRAERASQLASSSRPPRAGLELAATHLLHGWLTAVAEVRGSLETRLYQLAMTATSVDDNRRVWAGVAKVKKQIARP